MSNSRQKNKKWLLPGFFLLYRIGQRRWGRGGGKQNCPTRNGWWDRSSSSSGIVHSSRNGVLRNLNWSS